MVARVFQQNAVARPYNGVVCSDIQRGVRLFQQNPVARPYNGVVCRDTKCTRHTTGCPHFQQNPEARPYFFCTEVVREWSYIVLKYVLLGSLNYQALTGYQLKQWVDSATSHFWYAQTSQIYRTLDALEKDGLLTSEIQEQEDRPDRRLYHLTDAGRADLRRWLAQPMTEIEPTKDSLLVRLFFSAQLDKNTILTQLRVQRALRQQQLTLYSGDINAMIAAGVEHNPQLKRDALLWDATRRLGEMGEEVYIRWLDETIQRIEDEF